MRTRVRATLLTMALVLFAIAGWLYIAPSQIGGSTTYVITSGISMEPHFHSGDLAIVRPASQYRVGEVVAYRSSVLHVTVLHRIVAIRGGAYVFKGDNNHFLDPIRPTRSELIGVLWLRIPHGGVVLKLIHTPLVAALLTGVVGVLCLIGGQEARRRRRRRRSGASSASGRTRPKLRTMPFSGPVDLRPWLLGTTAAALAFLVLVLFAFSQPTRRATPHKLPFTQQMRFGYSAAVKPDQVYPDGLLHTGQPIFLRLVHRIQLTSDYRLLTAAVHQLAGTEQLALSVIGPSGWTRRFPLGRRMRFSGVELRTATRLDLTSVQRLLEQVGLITGVSGGGSSSIALVADIRIRGTVAGRRLDTSFAPSLGLELQPLQVQPGGGPLSSGGGFVQSKSGSVSVASTAPNDLKAVGLSIGVGSLRALGLIGFLLSSASLLGLAVLARLRAPFEESVRIQARYGHLIVPIVAAPDVLEQIPYDVTSIEALVRLAESGERLILHHRDSIADTYFLNDDTGVYRYQIGPQRVVWGEWQPPRPPAGYEPEPPPGPPVAPRPAFLSAAPDLSPPPEPEPPPTGVPLSAYTATAPAPAHTGQQLLARAAGRLARELVRSARRRRSGSPPAFGGSGD